MPNEDDTELSPALQAVQERALEASNKRRQKREAKSAAARKKNAPLIFSVVLLGLGAMAIGFALTSLVPELLSSEDQALLVVAVASIMAVLSGPYAAIQRIRAEQYRSQTPGVVSSAVVTGYPGGRDTGGIMYSVDAKVTYEVGGQQHVIDWHPGGSSNVYREAAGEKYVGRVLAVSFDPEQPQSAIVGRPDRNFVFARPVFALCCASAGAALGVLL
ncbi:MAG: DUF3592 domain-containing protein [Myxococcales bacterium]|nr:DUF3592 domain-containing protein [Myxococcales bacterium]